MSGKDRFTKYAQSIPVLLIIMMVSNTTARIIFNGLSFAALFWFVLLYSFVLLAWIKLGHFPVPSLNDPKYIGLDVMHAQVILTSPLIILSCASWVLLLPWSIRYKLLSKLNVVLFICGNTLVYLQLAYDPFDVICWLLD